MVGLEQKVGAAAKDWDVNKKLMINSIFFMIFPLIIGY